MKLKNYIIIFSGCILICLINFFTYYGLKISGEVFILFQVLNSIVYPSYISNYSYNFTKAAGKKVFILQGVVIISCYLLSYLIPSLNYIDIETFSIKMDGHGKALFSLIIGVGIVVSTISVIISQVLLLKKEQEYRPE